MRKNHSKIPMVTVQLMTYSGDVDLLWRSMESLRNQTLDPEQFEVQIVFDGKPTPKELAIIKTACEDSPFLIEEVSFDKPIGYYTLPRNRAFPKALGFYMVHMDADNEFKPQHLQGLLEAILEPHPTEGWAHFAYTRREYVHDEGADPALPKGETPLVPWTRENSAKVISSPQGNFIDTGDFIIGRSALYWLAERTGCIWNSELRRFGDWDLVCRMIACGFRGKAVDVATHVYHWTGKNLQTTRWMSDMTVIPESVYEQLKAEGKIRV